MAKLLGAITAAFPRARVVLTGYFPIVSDDSDLTSVDAILVALGLLSADTVLPAVTAAALKARVVENCRTFADRSRDALRAAVDEINASLGEPRAVFVDPGFADVNAVHAADPWLFGINLDLSPQDADVAGGRHTSCHEASTDPVYLAVCERASIGHPNRRGAEVFAEAIAEVL